LKDVISVLVRAKYHRGRQLRRRQQWVFGVYDPQMKRGFIQLVDDRSAETLLPIIQRTVVPGTLIACAYDSLLELNLKILWFWCIGLPQTRG